MPNPNHQPATSPFEVTAAGRQPALKQALGVWSAVAIVIGTVIGSGIFLVPTKMIKDVGSVQMLFLVWVVAGVLTLFGALTYAELSAAMPEAGGSTCTCGKLTGRSGASSIRGRNSQSRRPDLSRRWQQAFICTSPVSFQCWDGRF